MRAFLLAAILVLAIVPAADADVIVRTCNTATSCDDAARVPAPVACNVDYMKNGLGKPGSVRSDCLSS